MQCNIHIYLLNEHFSQEHADTHHQGKESENNIKFEWEDELSITSEVTNVSISENTCYDLKGEYPKGNHFNYTIPNMLLFKIESQNAEDVFIGASMSIVESKELIKKENSFDIALFLKDYEPMANPLPGIYIASKEFPKELIF
jgi:hypothetical protein